MSNAKKPTKFNSLWLNFDLYPQFKDWLKDVPDNIYQAFCTVCQKRFELSNMGIGALNSHYLRSTTHEKCLKAKFQQKPVIKFFAEKSTCNQTSPKVEISEATDSCKTSSATGKTSSATASNMNSYSLKDDVLKAECFWAMHVVTKKMSYNSCSNIAEAFQIMFPDSAIAKQFKLGSSKVAYLVSYGLAPYFLDKLMDRLKICTDYVISFDEAFNKIIHKGQMDLVIRFWDENLQQVSTRYLSSVFLGRATADDLLEKFIEGLSSLPFSKLLQVSMDGPNVNHCFLCKLIDKFEDDVSNSDGKKILNLGTCGLHVVHGSFKHGLNIVKWDLNNLLTHMYFLFKDSPSRRVQYTALTSSEIFPQKFCSTRWVENVQCLGRALEIFDNVKNFVENNKFLATKPAMTVIQAANDPLIKCKLSFFKTIASECEPFLKRFQSSKPLAPFLYEALHDLIRKLIMKFVNNDKLKAALTAKQLLDIDLSQLENLLHSRKIDVGFATKKFLAEAKVNENDVTKFRLECRKFLIGVIEKRKEKSPLKYSLVRGISAFDPFIIRHKPKNGVQRIEVALQCLHHANIINADVAEKAKHQYMNLTDAATVELKEEFDCFCKSGSDEMGLDKFFLNILADDKRFAELWAIIKLCLIFSHGNASVESGFSINKSLLIENLHEATLVNQRHVYDAIKESGGVETIDINSKLLSYARNSHKHYKIDLENKNKMEKNLINEKRLAKEQEKKIKELQERKRKIRKAAELEEKAIENELHSLKKKAL